MAMALEVTRVAICTTTTTPCAATTRLRRVRRVRRLARVRRRLLPALPVLPQPGVQRGARDHLQPPPVGARRPTLEVVAVARAVLLREAPLALDGLLTSPESLEQRGVVGARRRQVEQRLLLPRLQQQRSNAGEGGRCGE